jgi:hypothetical protein
VFDGLLPEPYNSDIMTLLFRLAEWHALAKLRLHIESTLRHMEAVTIALGKELRHFQDMTSTAFSTLELPKEAAARERRQARKQAKEGSEATVRAPKQRRVKTFNLSTYKVHALADYPNTIRRFGTTDSYSTQPVRF